jgi:hypothetical protein
MDCFKGCPEIKAPIVELMDCPKMVIKVKISTGKHIHIALSDRLTFLLIQKMAPNKSFTGLIKCSICSACVVSAMIDPIIRHLGQERTQH